MGKVAATQAEADGVSYCGHPQKPLIWRTRVGPPVIAQLESNTSLASLTRVL
jgi:hypothetical protein